MPWPVARLASWSCSRPARVARGMVVPVMLALAAGVAEAQWVPNYHIQRVGLFDAVHTRLGVSQTNFTTLGEDGVVGGLAFRYGPDGSDLGRDAWVWDGQTTRPVGLVGGEYLGSDGRQNTEFIALSAAANRVAGVSRRYAGALPFQDNGQRAWIFDGQVTRPVGFAGPGYQYAGGYQYNTVYFMNDQGRVVGGAFRASTDSGPNGQDLWLWDGPADGVGRQIGLTDPINTGASGYRSSNVQFLTPGGIVVGNSQRVANEFLPLGQDVWIFSGPAGGGTTRRITLLDATHLGSDGFASSDAAFVNDAGQVLGTAQNLLPDQTVSGQDVWIFDGTTTQAIGLLDATHTAASGYRYSEPRGLNSSGVAIGISHRLLSDGTFNGVDAWRYAGGTLTTLGLTGGVYTGNAGYRNVNALLINASGDVAGTSGRFFNASDGLGTDAWVYRGGTTRLIGAFGPGYTYSREGLPVRNVLPQTLTDNGLVFGRSLRYPVGFSDVSIGQDPWVWNPTDGTGATQIIALPDDGHITSNGYRFSLVREVTPSGQAWGYTDRFAPDASGRGRDAWVWSRPAAGGPGVTRQLGPTGGIYTGSTGYQLTEVQFQNASGVIVGYTYRVSGEFGYLGVDAWYYDPATNQTSIVPPNVRYAFDNSAVAYANILTDDGFLIGSYYYFENGDGNGELRGFAFRPDRGFIELGGLLPGGAAANGWRVIAAPEFSDGVTSILGVGDINNRFNQESVYAISPDLCAGPVITAQPQAASVCPGTPVSLSVQVTSAPDATFQWLRNGQPIDVEVTPSAASASLSLGPATPQSAGSYVCRITTACASIMTPSAQVEVFEATDPRCAAPTCNADINRDGVLDQGDVDAIINLIAGANNPLQINLDFNGDEVADQGDVDAVINVVAGGQCP